MHTKHDDTDTGKRRVCVYLFCVHELLCKLLHAQHAHTDTQYRIPPLSTGCFAVSFAQKFLKHVRNLCVFLSMKSSIGFSSFATAVIIGSKK